jgi:hypothetical protein
VLIDMKGKTVSSDCVVRRYEKCGFYTTLIFGYAVNCTGEFTSLLDRFERGPTSVINHIGTGRPLFVQVFRCVIGADLRALGKNKESALIKPRVQCTRLATKTTKDT